MDNAKYFLNESGAHIKYVAYHSYITPYKSNLLL